MKYFLPFLMIVLSVLPSCTRVDPDSPEFQEAVVKAIEARKEDIFKIMAREARESQGKRRKEAMEKAKADMEVQFKNPLEPIIEGRNIIGNPNAPITIVEYSDFQCPYCKKGNEIINQIFQIYPGKVRLIFKHLPLQSHRHAMVAAKGAIAAEKQGKFKRYHDILFDNQSKINRNFILTTAKSLGMNIPAFVRVMDSPETEKIIKEDIAEANRFGITGTPGFIINGVALKGAFPLQQFKSVIDRHLSKK